MIFMMSLTYKKALIITASLSFKAATAKRVRLERVAQSASTKSSDRTRVRQYPGFEV